MAKIIALFNHKGGVSKTTTTFNLGWMLAEKGKKVILVDTDPQCNLSGLILGFKGEDEFEAFYQSGSSRNFMSGLAPAFESQPRALQAIDCIPVENREGLFLLPGHIRLSEYEVTLGIAQELSSTIQTLRNLPGSMAYLLEITAKKYDADFVLIDMSPSLSSINQNLLMTSDYFIVPTSPDYFSLMAIESLNATLPKWKEWSNRAKTNPVLRDAEYPYPDKTPKFLGTVIQKYRPRGGSPTEGFQKWIDSINSRVVSLLVPTLKSIGMTLDDSTYQKIDKFDQSFCLSQIADFNTLIAKSQEAKKPVFTLEQADLQHVGIVLESDLKKVSDFHDEFAKLAICVMELVDDEISA